MANDELYDSPFRKLPFGIKPKYEPLDNVIIDEGSDDFTVDPIGDPSELPPEKDPTDDKPKPPEIVLEAPKNLRIVEEIMHHRVDGSIIVDVILEFDDVENAVGYDHRITKL